MKRLVEFSLEGDGSVFVEVDAAVGGSDRIAAPDPRQLGDNVAGSFQQAFARVKPAVAIAVEQLRGLAVPPGEVTVKFGLKLTAEAGAIISSAGAEANFEITLKWKDAPP